MEGRSKKGEGRRERRQGRKVEGREERRQRRREETREEGEGEEERREGRRGLWLVFSAHTVSILHGPRQA